MKLNTHTHTFFLCIQIIDLFVDFGFFDGIHFLYSSAESKSKEKMFTPFDYYHDDYYGGEYCFDTDSDAYKNPALDFGNHSMHFR